MKNKFKILSILIIIFSVCVYAQKNVRIKDVASITGLEEIQLFGYGLVMGLAGTGDRNQTIFTSHTIANLLKNMGMELPEKQIRVRNVAAVMVTGTLSPFKRKGTFFDVTISSLGDASSLEGGILLISPLQGTDGINYATAQGAVSTGGYDVDNKSLGHYRKNHAVVARIPDGAIVQKEYEIDPLNGTSLSLSLNTPDFTSAVSMTRAINEVFSKVYPFQIAKERDAATIQLSYDIIARDSIRNRMNIIEFISMVENISFDAAVRAKVVVNERTGTIVAGGDVRISEIAVTHGGIKVEVVNTPQVVQPQPFTNGSMEVIPNPEVIVDEKNADMIVLKGTTTVSDLAQSLNSLGVTPRDVIAILQAIKEAGALHAQLVIL